MHKLMLSVCLSALLLTACAMNGRATDPTPAPVVVDTGCKWAGPIYVSKADALTDETARQILAHNQTFVAICGKPATPQLPKEQQPGDRPDEKPRS